MIIAISVYLLGETAWSTGWGVPAFAEKTRDTHSFTRRVGALPVQQAGETLDYR